MVGEGAEKKFYDAAAIGDVTTFQQLLQKNPNLVDVVSCSCHKNVLHIAIKQGQEMIVEEVLKINPELARELDSKNSSSLHIAAAQGNVEIAKRLLSMAPEMCWWRDCHDMNPIHIAAMKGKAEVLKEMLQFDLFPAMERLHRGQTALHLCVKHRQIETLKVLVDKLGKKLVCAKDDDGETPLHLAVRSNQLEIILYLVQSNKIENLTMNSMGETELDVLQESSRDKLEIITMLNTLSTRSLMLKQLPKATEMTMVVVVLIATMAFQAVVSPPGGVWQDNTSSHSAGKAVMATTHPKIYKHFIRANTTAFISSLITIFLITTRTPEFVPFATGIAALAMLVSMASIGISYGASLTMTNPMETPSVGHLIAIVLSVFFGYIILGRVYQSIEESWLSCKRKRRQQMDLTNIRAFRQDRIDRRERLYRRNKYLYWLKFGRWNPPSRTVQEA